MARHPLQALLVFAALALAFCAPTCAAAADPTEPDYLSFNLGYVGVVRHPEGLLGGFDYRWHQNLWNIHPAVRVGFTAESRYVNASLVYTCLFANRWFFNLSSGPGSYSRDRKGENLGLPLEFLSSIDIGREIGHGQRLSLGFSHISNAHLGPTNPGNEVVLLTYSMPVRR